MDISHHSIIVPQKLTTDNIFTFSYSLDQLATLNLRGDNDSLFMPHRVNIHQKPSPVCMRMEFDNWLFEERDNLK